MTDAAAILRECTSVLVIDWSSRDVPEALVRTGMSVFVKGGPGPKAATSPRWLAFPMSTACTSRTRWACPSEPAHHCAPP
jgi:hypothetical protein